jgi:hypothetical protein
MSKTYVAVDIGASSGRLMMGHLVDGKLELKEVHRFKNGFSKKMGTTVGILIIFYRKFS